MTSTGGARPRLAWWRRLVIALIAGYLAGYILEGAMGNWDPRHVGWSRSYVPVAVEGAVFAFIMRGLLGIVLAPLPLLIVPETWERVQRLMELVGPGGLAILVPPLPVMWLAGVVGAAVHRFAPWLEDG